MKKIKKNKLFAPFLMLLAGAVASLMMFYFRYTSEQMLPRLLAVLIVFYVAGAVIQRQVTVFVDKIKAEEEAKEREAKEREAAEKEREAAAGAADNMEKETPESAA